MDLILTHEQADFDAIAALVAAHKLYPNATPVRPRRLNRNVAAFLTIYGGELSLADPDTLRRQAVGRVFLVDTQRLISIRGVHAKTPVHVIDHHTLRSIPDHWTHTIEPLGSTTTLLAEQLRRQALPLTPIEATLLLLGIYEDTGNLTYLSTTARDALAVAYILDCGPRLNAVRDFLNQPLAADQQVLYQALLQNAQTIIRANQPVLITTGTIEDRQTEIAAVVQVLRDTVEAVAVLALVQIESDVELVARSSSGSIDVGLLARHFGGGGHKRAAAALITNTDVAEVVAEVRQMLDKAVQPPITVARIMSRGAQTLAEHLSITAAATHLQRYGHEGDLVVNSDAQVVGLITRKAVDHAVAHGLGNESIATVMETGQVSVAPTDTIEQLQQVMIASGWGQVPVIEAGKLHGIVTRTDLIGQLAQPARSLRPNLSDKLTEALPAARLAFLRQLGEAAQAQAIALFIVGGFVRDLLLDTPSLDFDLVVEGNAIKLAQALAATYGGRVVSHRRFGTAKWFLPKALAQQVELDTLDLVSARQEFYTHPSALPEVEHSSIKHDLHRRDFTLNTLAIQIDGEHFGELLDYYSGERDLREGRIRVLHSLSFIDDPTRLLRAVRLATRFDFALGARTAQLMTQALPTLPRVSGDRIRHELEAVLKESEPEKILQQLDELGILAAIHPALNADPALAKRLAAARAIEAANRTPLYFAAWLGALPADELPGIFERLNLSVRLRKPIRQLSKLRAQLQALPPDCPLSDLDRILNTADPLALQALPLLLDTNLVARLDAYQQALRNIQPALKGSDLITRGYPPGPEIGALLEQLRWAWLDNEIVTAADEKRWLENKEKK